MSTIIENLHSINGPIRPILDRSGAKFLQLFQLQLQAARKKVYAVTSSSSLVHCYNGDKVRAIWINNRSENKTMLAKWNNDIFWLRRICLCYRPGGKIQKFV